MAVQIPLTTSGFALVDEEDAPFVSLFKWHGRNGYASSVAPRGGAVDSRQAPFTMHRFLMGEPDRPLVVDHINGDRLDNRRCNLRITTQQVNMLNVQQPRRLAKSGLRGVTAAYNGRYTAAYQGRHLGTFDCPHAAAAAVQQAKDARLAQLAGSDALFEYCPIPYFQRERWFKALIIAVWWKQQAARAKTERAQAKAAARAARVPLLTGPELRDLRMLSGVSTGEVAEALDCCRILISYYELGKRGFNRDAEERFILAISEKWRPEKTPRIAKVAGKIGLHGPRPFRKTAEAANATGLRQYRVAAGLTLAAVADATNVKTAQLSLIERGLTPPPASVLAYYRSTLQPLSEAA